MSFKTSILNNSFGFLFDGLTRADFNNEDFQKFSYKRWIDHHGLLVFRGRDLEKLSPHNLISISENFGIIEQSIPSARENCMVANFPILRIGNIRNEMGEMISQSASVPQLKSRIDIQYNQLTKRPVWHTDSTFLAFPPVGSVFHCKQAPLHGGETLFADTRNGYKALDEKTKRYLLSLEAICSLAHHDKKVNLYSPDYPTLTSSQRVANPPNRVPVVLKHPITGKYAIYGLNSSTCAIVKKGETIAPELMDVFDLTGEEDESVNIIRNLLPHLTSNEHTVCWEWQPGDVVIWDNRCTIHAGTGFDQKKYAREMWRLTLMSDNIVNFQALEAEYKKH